MAGRAIEAKAVERREDLEVERKLVALGAWRRCVARDVAADDRRLLVSVFPSRTASEQLVSLDDLQRHAREAASIIHPGCSRVVRVRRDELGLWVWEEIAEGLPLAHSLPRQMPDEPYLSQEIVRVIEAIAYLHRHEMSHGQISVDTVFSNAHGLQLTGLATAPARGDRLLPSADVRAWGQIGRHVLELKGRPGANNSRLRELLNRSEMAGRTGEPSDGPQMAALVHQALAVDRQGAGKRRRPGRPTAPAADPAGRPTTALGTTMLVLRGLLTTVLTVALIAGATSGGVLWALARGPAEVTVPNLIGMSHSQASQRLEEMGLREGRTREVYRNDIASGKVAATEPPLGMKVRQGRQVALVISRGSAQVQVPNLVGVQAGEAEAALREKGLKLRVEARRRSPAPTGEIVEQDPAAEEQVGRGAEVRVVVSGGEDYGTIRAVTPEGEERDVLFRSIKIVVPAGDPIQRVKVLEGYRGQMRTTYDRLHRPGEHVTVNTHGFEGKRIEVQIEGETVYETRL